MKKIKVAHVITRLILGGAQENTLLTVEGLHARPDYEVTLITGPALGPEGSLLDRARNNVSVTIVPELRRNIQVYNDFIALCKLVRLFKENQYDIVHTHSSKAGILGRLAARITRTPIVIHTIHGLPFHDYEKKINNALFIFLERWMARYTHKIITVCPEMIKKATVQRIGKPDQYMSIYSGMEIDQFIHVETQRVRDLKRMLGIQPNDIIVGKIARLFHLKGHHDLLRAAREVIKRHPRVKYLLVGDGVLFDELKRQAREYGIEKNIIFAGLVPPKDIPVYIQCMDVVVHLSLREGLPRVVPQAFLGKKPVVVYDIDGAKDIVVDGTNGFLIMPKDIEGLVEKIEKLIDDALLRKRMGDAGYATAMLHFDHIEMVNAISNCYKEVLGYD